MPFKRTFREITVDLGIWPRRGPGSEMILHGYQHGQFWPLGRPGPEMAQHGFKNICFDHSKKIQANLPITKIIYNYYRDIQNKGGNRLDTSSLISLLK